MDNARFKIGAEHFLVLFILLLASYVLGLVAILWENGRWPGWRRHKKTVRKNIDNKNKDHVPDLVNRYNVWTNEG